jgi:hypothetical protein
VRRHPGRDLSLIFSLRRHAEAEVHRSDNGVQLQEDALFSVYSVPVVSSICKMAGAVRQPIDLQSLELYISHNVPEIKVPVDIKQVVLCSDFVF